MLSLMLLLVTSLTLRTTSADARIAAGFLVVSPPSLLAGVPPVFHLQLTRVMDEQPEPPYMVLLDHEGNAFYKLQVDNLHIDQINDLVRDLGFYRKSHGKDPDPEEYKSGIQAPPDGTTVQQLTQGTSKWSQYGEVIEPEPAESVVPLDRMKDPSLKHRVLAFLEELRATRPALREEL